jgi:hypothetical protein
LKINTNKYGGREIKEKEEELRQERRSERKKKE